MATNLLDTLRSLVTPQVLAAASTRLGESENTVAKGLGAAFPLILAALMQKLNSASVMSRIMNLLTSRTADAADVLANPGAVLSGEPSSSDLTTLGSNLLSAVFDTHLQATTNALAEHAGVRLSSASSLMTLAAAMVGATLGERVRRDGLDGPGLASLLDGQRDSILSGVPGTLASAAGLGALLDTGTRATGARRDVPRRESSGWLWAAAAAVVIALGGWALWSSRDTRHMTETTTEAAREAGDVAQRPGEAVGDAAQRSRQAAGDAPQAVGEMGSDAARQWEITIAKLGPLTTRRLPTNVELSFPERGVEMDIIAFLDDPSKQTDPVVWFNFDRLLFETGSAALRPESQQQLRNVAEILKAYPTVKVKIGGYTDNTGDPAANLKLSQDRATSVRNAIVGQGIAPERVSAEGFGEQHPVADNSTEEGRQQNRRIAMRVTEK